MNPSVWSGSLNTVQTFNSIENYVASLVTKNNLQVSQAWKKTPGVRKNISPSSQGMVFQEDGQQSPFPASLERRSLASSWDTWELQLVEPSLILFCSFSVSSLPKQCRQRGAHHLPTSSTVVSKDAPGVRARVTALVTKCCTNSTFWVLSDNTEHQIVFRKCEHANHAPRTGGHKERECLA